MKATVTTLGHVQREVSKVSPGGFTAHFAQSCAGCHGNAKSVRREFSDQAWSALLAWGEIHTAAVDQPICNDCYFNLREVLIDRTEEISAAANPIPSQPRRAGARAATV